MAEARNNAYSTPFMWKINIRLFFQIILKLNLTNWDLTTSISKPNNTKVVRKAQQSKVVS